MRLGVGLDRALSASLFAAAEADPLGRGIEGCMPGTSGAEMPSGYSAKKDAEEALPGPSWASSAPSYADCQVSLLCALVSQWREWSRRACSEGF